jgi:hypothetical protein
LPIAKGKGKLKSASLDARVLNRTLLHRQLLLKRRRMSALEALEHLVGMQAQVPNSPYVGLWSRLAGFRPDHLGDSISNRLAVRIALMRNTLHLVTAGDCLAIRPVVQRLMARAYRKADGQTLRAMVAAGRAIVEAQPRTNVEIGRLLQTQFPRHDRLLLGYAIRDNLPLVQIPPRGLWGQSSAPTLTTVDVWLGRALDDSSEPDQLILRYLKAFGPASVADIQAWSGLAGLKTDLERLRPRLRVRRDDRGRELFDVPDGALVGATAHAPVRFLPEYDNLLVAHADRSRIIPPEHRGRVGKQLGRPPVLVDGFVRAFWRVAQAGESATLEIHPFDAVAKRKRNEIEAEGRRLLRFIAPRARGAGTHHVKFTSG